MPKGLRAAVDAWSPTVETTLHIRGGIVSLDRDSYKAWHRNQTLTNQHSGQFVSITSIHAHRVSAVSLAAFLNTHCSRVTQHSTTSLKDYPSVKGLLVSNKDCSRPTQTSVCALLHLNLPYEMLLWRNIL